jgi:hypothetical protein
MTRKNLPVLGPESGTTLVEALVATALSLVVLAALLGLFDMENRLSRDQSDVVAMQNNARADIAEAGYGITSNSMLGWAGVIMPNADNNESYTTDAITLWSNPGDILGTVVRDMPAPSSELVVDRLDGFVVGAAALIVGPGPDGQLHYDWFIVTHVQSNQGAGELHLQHSPPTNPEKFTTSYLEGSYVLAAQNVSYYLEEVDGVSCLMRRVAGQPGYPVAEHITSLRFTYFDDSQPKQQIDPVATKQDRKSIRSVEVELTANTARAALDTREVRRFTLASETAPRNLGVLEGI